MEFQGFCHPHRFWTVPSMAGVGEQHRLFRWPWPQLDQYCGSLLCLSPITLDSVPQSVHSKPDMRPSTRVLQACRITFFTRANCSLCTNAKKILSNVWDSRPFVYQEIDVMAPGGEIWREYYEFDTPVVGIKIPALQSKLILSRFMSVPSKRAKSFPKEFPGQRSSCIDSLLNKWWRKWMKWKKRILRLITLYNFPHEVGGWERQQSIVSCRKILKFSQMGFEAITKSKNVEAPRVTEISKPRASCSLGNFPFLPF